MFTTHELSFWFFGAIAVVSAASLLSIAYSLMTIVEHLGDMARYLMLLREDSVRVCMSLRDLTENIIKIQPVDTDPPPVRNATEKEAEFFQRLHEWRKRNPGR